MRRRQFISDSLIAGTVLGTVPFACTHSFDTEVLILGGGISGLYLAYLLDKAGKGYILIEGSDRFGGRMFFHPTIQQDVGGRGIGDKYKEIMSLVNDLDIDLIDITELTGGGRSYYVNNTLIPSFENRADDPALLEFVTPETPPDLEALDDWYKRSDLDQSYSDYLKKLGRTDEEIALLNISANYNDVYNTSCINSLHSRAFRKFNGSKVIYNFAGGTKSLINAIVESLKGDLRLNKIVTSISAKDNGITVSCEDGTSLKAAKVVCTLPFSTLRDVDLDLSLNPKQKTAIQGLSYTAITQIHFDAIEPYWEADKLSPSMWTDTALERIMTFGFGDDNRHLVAWVNGKGTHQFDTMSDSSIANFLLSEMKKIRPASEGKIEYTGTHSWGQYKFNKGAYCEFNVGQSSLFADMIKPAGNVHFAGEHTATHSRGIEGAAESAKRVYNELMI